MIALLLASLLSGQCDASLWRHVYNPTRLHVLQTCISVPGIIEDATAGKHKDGARREADGDTHGWLKPDDPSGLLSAGNRSAEGGNLVFEVVCRFNTTQADAKAACRGYRSALALPAVGAHVVIIGALVQDSKHAKWNEIHPVTSITIAPR